MADEIENIETEEAKPEVPPEQKLRNGGWRPHHEEDMWHHKKSFDYVDDGRTVHVTGGTPVSQEDALKIEAHRELERK
jgi:hypothetical protein